MQKQVYTEKIRIYNISILCHNLTAQICTESHNPFNNWRHLNNR